MARISYSQEVLLNLKMLSWQKEILTANKAEELILCLLLDWEFVVDQVSCFCKLQMIGPYSLFEFGPGAKKSTSATRPINSSKQPTNS